jgi:Meckel syndrome type 1 protein
MLDVVAAPPPKPAANAAPASSARSVEKDDAGFQGRLREALDLPPEGDPAQNIQAAPKTLASANEKIPAANIAKAPEGIAGTDAAGLPPPAEALPPVELIPTALPAAFEAIAPLTLPVIDSAVAAAQADQALAQIAPSPANVPTELVGMPLASGAILGQPSADQPGMPLQDAVLGDGAQPVSTAPPMTGSAVAAPTQSDKGADKGAVALPPSQTAGMGAAATNTAAQLLEGAPPAAGDAAAPSLPALVAKDLLAKDQGSPEWVLQDTFANALAAGPVQAVAGVAAQKSQAAGGAEAPLPPALVATDLLTKDQVPPDQALQDTLANVLATAPAQAAAGAAALKPQAAGNTSKREPIAPAEAALAATRPAEAASRLAQAFNATEAAADMKLVMAAETAEASLRLASLEAPNPTGAKPSGEARAEAVPMAAFGFAPTDGMAPRAEAALPSTNLREAPAPMPARQLAPVLVSLALGSRDEALTIALDPVELGRVEVSIGQGKEAGQVRIVAERPETLALLQRDQRELDRALNQSGLGDMARSLSFSLASDQGRHQQQGSAHGRGQRASMTISGVEADRAMSALPALYRNPNALIDIAV